MNRSLDARAFALGFRFVPSGDGSMPSDWPDEAGDGVPPPYHGQRGDRHDGEAGGCD